MNKDFKIVAIVFICICFGISQIKHNIELKKAYKLVASEKAAKIAAMKIAVEIINEKDEYIFILQEAREQLNDEIEDLNVQLKEYKTLEKLKKDLDRSKQ